MRSPKQHGGVKSLQVRTVSDLDKVAEVLASQFKTNTVVIVGSQSVLVGWPEAPALMRTSPEIDAYPANARSWETACQTADPQNAIQASEMVNAHFGVGSPFHERHGFYIDGVDDRTAALPKGWQTRAVYREIRVDDAVVTVVAPCSEDMIAAKTKRLELKDRAYIEAYHEVRPLDIALLCERVASANFSSEDQAKALSYLRTLPNLQPKEIISTDAFLRIPEYPELTHSIFVDKRSGSLTVRKWDDETNLYGYVDNPVDVAFIGLNQDAMFSTA